MNSKLNKIIYLAGAVSAAAGLFLALPALAVDLGLPYAAPMGLPNFDIRTMVAGVIRSLLGFVGLYLVLRIMQGGFLMMTHGGNEEKRAEAMAIIKNSIIGVFIILSASSIANFVLDAVMKAVGDYS